MPHPVCAVPSGPVYNATRDFLPCIPRGLGLEIVRVTVNYNGPANDIVHTKPDGQHLAVSLAVITEQRRKITGVSGMRCSFRIVITTRVREAAAATVVTLVDMKSKEACF